MRNTIALPFPCAKTKLLQVRSATANIDFIVPRPGVDIVGTRQPSSNSSRLTFSLSVETAELGFTVINSLALGCDTAAHCGCLSIGGRTVAVLPCGVDRIAPVSNTRLGETILDSGGCLVSEYPPGTLPRNFRFVERNRVIAVLSQAVIVAEAEIKSGTMRTARFALEGNKPLACYIPESSEVSPGCLHLVKHHCAIPLRTPDELKSFLGTLPRKPKRRGEGRWNA